MSDVLLLLWLDCEAVIPASLFTISATPLSFMRNCTHNMHRIMQVGRPLLTQHHFSLLQQKHNKPVGFHGPIAPPVPNAPSSECPRASIAARRRAAGSIRISRRASYCCSSAIAGIAIGANFKFYLLRQFCSNRVEFFLQRAQLHCKRCVSYGNSVRLSVCLLLESP